MLGEGVCIMKDVECYFNSYMMVIYVIGKVVNGCGFIKSLGILVKIFVIYLCYEFIYCECVIVEIVFKLKEFVFVVKSYDIGFIVDVEEVDCLDILLDVIEVVFSDDDLGNWNGFGLVV